MNLEQSDTLRELRDRLRTDLEPVRPLQSERLCLGVAIVFAAISIAILSATHGLRPDREALGEFWLWGPSVLQLLLALTALGLAMKESLPGQASSSGVLWAAAAAGLACHVAAVLGVSRGVVGEESSTPFRDFYGFGLEVCIGVPLVVAALWIAQRGFTAHTGRLGLMAGLGAAFAADAIWRLFCSISDPSHVFASHTLGIAAITLAGWCLAAGWKRRLMAETDSVRASSGAPGASS